ncbi:retropepsin-like aspartic protease [Flavobacterium rhizosphaerae]|uniref:Aspartyl protease family protein n=1 Tax=Flavobacterium rhizosphaerae TaxID=3163298 RepID=A0ABW8Z2W7_9FLAO
MKYILLLLLVPFLVLSQTDAQKEAIKNRDKYLFGTTRLQKNFVKTIPFEYGVNEEIVVPVQIGGEIYHFLFDTGATTIVSQEIKDKLELHELFSNEMVDGSGQIEQMPVYILDKLAFSDIEFKDVAVIASDFKKFGSLFCEKIDGLLGTNIMRTCHWKIDYKNRQLIMSDKKIKPSKNFYPIDFKEGFSGSPLLTVYMGGYSVIMLMDTGYNGGFSIPDSLFFKSEKLRSLPYNKGYGNSTITLYNAKPRQKYLAAIDSVYIENKRHLVKNGIADIDEGETFLIGNDIFEGFGEVILDWDKKRIYLPETVVEEDDKYNTFGFGPAYDDGTITIALVWEGSSAFTQGLEVGDVVISINGTDCQNIDRKKWCALVGLIKNKETKTLPVTIKKKDGTEKGYILKRGNLFE